jgi:hypothetical protein
MKFPVLRPDEKALLLGDPPPVELRPKKLTPEMALRAARKIADALVANSMIGAGEAETCARDIANHGMTGTDGYQLAKDLDDYCGWDPDFRMVEELDQFQWLARSEIEAAEKEWFARTSLQPPFPIGAHIAIGDGETGEITGIYEHGVAKYLVKIDGDPDAKPNNRGGRGTRRIVNFEDVKPAPADKALQPEESEPS